MPQIEDTSVKVPTTPYLLVTVGTTKFDQLISTIDTHIDTIITKVCIPHNISTILLQIGSAEYIPQHLDTAATTSASTDHPITIEWFKFTTDFAHLLQNATMVISHAGAGSILETLRSPKPLNTKPKLFVVINELLMDNHQLELADAFAVNSYLFYSTCSDLIDKIQLCEWNMIQPYPLPNDTLFVNLVAQTLVNNGITSIDDKKGQ